jgi:hypothetical protein
VACLAALCAAAVAAEERHSSEGTVIDRAVAVVDGQLITLSELEFEARVGLIQRGGTRGAEDPLNDEARRSALQLSIVERLETAEADKLHAFVLEESEVEAAVREFRARFENEAAFSRFLARNDVDLQQLGALLGRRIRAAKALDSKIRLRSSISDSETRRHFDEHRADFNHPYTEVREQIQQKLFRDRYNERVKAELKQMRKQADVRLIAPFARQVGLD